MINLKNDQSFGPRMAEMDTGDGENLLAVADDNFEEAKVMNISDDDVRVEDDGEGSEEETLAEEDGSEFGLKRKIKEKASI